MGKQTISGEPDPAYRQLNVVTQALLQLHQAPEVRQEKIQPLAKAIRTNTYRIDCRQLADCLITSLLFGLLR